MSFSKIRVNLTNCGHDFLVDPLAGDVSTLRQHGLIDSRRNLIDKHIDRLEFAQADANDDVAPSFAGYHRLARKLLGKPILVADNTSTIPSLRSRRNHYFHQRYSPTCFRSAYLILIFVILSRCPTTRSRDLTGLEVYHTSAVNGETSL